MCRIVRSVAFDDPSGAVIAFDPVTVFHAFDTDFSAGTRGMQEVIVAKVDANVREGAAHGVEEHQVTRF